MFRNLICLLLSYALVFQASFALEVNGELKNALGEKLASDPVTGLVEGRIYFNTTTKTLRVYDGSAWRNKVDTNSTQTLTNKTINGNNNTLNVLAPTQLEGFVPIANGGTGQSSKAAAYDALSPNGSQGDLTYRGVSSNVALPVGANGQVLTVASGYPSWADSTGGAGSGEKNYVTNPSAATAITGWTCVGDLSVVRTTTAADLPRENTTPSGIKITATAGTQSTADYCYFNFTLDDIDLNRKLNVKFGTKQTGSYVSNDLAVVITTQADRTTAVATPAVTNIAAADYDFNGNGFDTASTTTLSLVIRATADMATSAGVTISDVVVGPGTIIAVPAIGPWQSYTPTISNLTTTSVTGRWRRVNDSMEIRIQADPNGSASGTISFSIPSGYTIDTTALTSTSVTNTQLGTAFSRPVNSATAAVFVGSVTYNSSTTVAVWGNDQTTYPGAGGNWNATVPATWAISGDTLNLDFTIPVAEWAGSPNYAGQNDVEWASSTTGTWDAAAAAINTVYGPQGSPITSALTADRDKVVRFQTPIQITDDIQLFLIDQNGKPTPFSSVIPTSLHPTFDFGPRIESISGQDVTIRFRQFAIPGTTYNSTTGAINWNTALGSNKFWVLRKAKSGAAIGFSAATTISNGLLQPPTNTADAKATQMGLKSYAHGTTYNGGIAPTITLTGGGGVLLSVDSSYFVPYQMQDGSWRLRGNFTVTLDSQTRTTAQLTVNGVTFAASQAISATSTATAATISRMRSNNASGALDVLHSSATTTTYYFSFDVVLSSKPTWAY